MTIEQQGLPLHGGFPDRAVRPLWELSAYESLWVQHDKMTFKRMAELFAANPGALPSELAEASRTEAMLAWLVDHYREMGRFGVRVHRAGEYPRKLRDARYPVEVLTYRGVWNWVESPCVAIVGTRRPSEAGVQRARQLVRDLAADGYTIVSGLAAGIDTAAHTAALALGAPTIAVLGTPLSHHYPRDNAELQEEIARRFCVISQIPAYRYSQQDWRINRTFFPERNVTMSALTEATIIVEASETSGTLSQARAALHQGRKLFILESCFQNPALTWPARFESKGAVRLTDYEQLREHLQPAVAETADSNA